MLAFRKLTRPPTSALFLITVLIPNEERLDASKRLSGSAILKRFIFAGAQRLLDGVFVVLLETRINQRTTESNDGHVLVKVPSTRMNSNWRPEVGVTRPAALVSFRQILKFVTRRRLGGPRFVCASLTHLTEKMTMNTYKTQLHSVRIRICPYTH